MYISTAMLLGVGAGLVIALLIFLVAQWSRRIGVALRLLERAINNNSHELAELIDELRMGYQKTVYFPALEHDEKMEALPKRGRPPKRDPAT